MVRPVDRVLKVRLRQANFSLPLEVPMVRPVDRVLKVLLVKVMKQRMGRSHGQTRG